MSDQPAYLFIGGCADGRRIVTDGQSLYRVPVLQSFLPSVHREDGITTRDEFAIDHEYRLMQFSAGRSVYVMNGMDLGEVLSKLIEHYHPGEVLTGKAIGTVAGELVVECDRNRVKDILFRGGLFEPVTVVVKAA